MQPSMPRAMQRNPGHTLMERLQADLLQLDHHGLVRGRRQVQSVSSTECLVDGQRCVSFAANDYLGLAHDPRVTRRFAAAAEDQAGSRASPLVAGRSPMHQQLEADLARFEGTAAAILFPSGYSANVGCLTSLISPRDAVFCDRDNHASIIDGCRAAAGKLLVYRHQQLDRLDSALEKRRAEFDQVFIVTDSVFSMDGTLAPLDVLAEIADRHAAVLIVDEAHGTGVFGTQGRGVCELLGVEDRVPVRIGTLSKSIGALGGFAAAEQTICDWLWNTARTQFFSTALPAAICAAAGAALQIIQQEPERRVRLHRVCQFARNEIERLGLRSVEGNCGPVIPILTGVDQRAVQISQQLLRNGFFVPAIRPPTVPPGTARLRLSVCSEHTETQIADVLRQVAELSSGQVQ